MGARPYRLCSDSAIARAQLHATQALQRWSIEWVGPTAAGQIAVEVSQQPRAPAAANEEAGRWLRAQGSHGTLWIETSQQALIGRLLFGPSAAAVRPGTLAASSATQALEALLLELAAADSFQQASAPVHLKEAGRAGVQLIVRWGSESLLVQGELAHAPRPAAAARSPLGSLVQALGAQPVTLQACLGSTELDLQTLQMLRVGDVLRLDKRVDEGLDLSVAGEELRCGGYLVALEGAKAIEFTRQPLPHHP